LPRERIDWSPRINYDACLGDRACYEFCHNDVFTWDEANGRPIVAKPNNCVLGCDSCGQLCPAEAISFPSKDELRATMRQLKAELAAASNQLSSIHQLNGRPENGHDRER
ncbi:MAG TPA: hypothetical protein VHN81_02805, partial [Edaphobacter sp.]|nr:hypothetical protein [Edaphobacter sp.]